MAQLARMDEMCALRERHAAYMREELKKIPGVYPQESYPESTRQNYYCFGLRYDAAHFNGLSCAKLIEALNAEGIPISAGYPPLNKEPFIEANLTSRGFQTAFTKERLDKYRKRSHCPHNDELCATSKYLVQQVLIGSKEDVDNVVEAFDKVQRNAADLT